MMHFSPPDLLYTMLSAEMPSALLSTLLSTEMPSALLSLTMLSA